MRANILKIFLIAGVVLLFLLSARKSALAEVPENVNDRYIYKIAEILKRDFNTSIDPLLVVAMVRQESNFEPLAERVELHIKNDLSLYSGMDKSIGVMQVLTSTAMDMYNKGYTKYGKPTIKILQNPIMNMYFGMAYIDWLQQRAIRNNRAYNNTKIAEWYNGGYGNSNSQTRTHASKVVKYFNQYAKELI